MEQRGVDTIRDEQRMSGPRGLISILLGTLAGHGPQRPPACSRPAPSSASGAGRSARSSACLPARHSSSRRVLHATWLGLVLGLICAD